MKSMKLIKKAQAGFTLIELMIVVAIIGILAAVAIPQYQNYTIRAKIANALTAVDSLKTAVALCIQEAGGVPDLCDAGSNGVPAVADFTRTKEVASIASINNGVIVQTLATGVGSGIDGLTITHTPSTGVATATNLTWTTSTTVTNATASAAILKNNVAAAPATP